MRNPPSRLLIAAACASWLVALAGVSACGDGTTRPPGGTGELCADAGYATSIQPLFDQDCLQCHRVGVESGGLDLENHAGTLGGGLSGASVIPGDCDGSLLYQMVARDTQPFMPPGGPMSAGEVDCICAWIAAGALDD